MSNGEGHRGDATAGGAGTHSIAGYEYQIDVSVWLALDLVVANRLAHELILEPATQEDIEANLAEFEPGRVTSATTLDGYRLIVQAKLRTGDAWTVSGVKALLKHGESRASAAKRLEDPVARYLLVTSAGLNGRTRGLRVRRAGSWPKPADMPANIRSALPAGVAGRVAIISNQDEERLDTDIKELLTESFRVPKARLNECRRVLREEARVRMLGAGGGRWTRLQLEQLIRRHDGYFASSPELDLYVPPTNWAELQSSIRDRHAALIIGRSGTGKTMAARKLFEELRKVIPALQRVPITHGPEQLREDRTEPPVLYDIEDPWGRYDFDPKSRPWNDLLAQCFAEARHDRMIVATSRLDVAQSAGALDSVKPWLVGLEAEHYGEAERRRLYLTRIDALPRKLQTLAKESLRSVLAALATPLEIQKFFDALPTLGEEMQRNPPGLVAEAIRRAHQNSIERTVIDQIEGRRDVRAAAVIWGLLKANNKISLGLLRQIEEALADKEPQFERGAWPFVSFFISARNLRQTESTLTYYHPRVEAGIEQALLRDRLVTRRTLRLLIDVLTSLDGPGEDWGVAASIRLLLEAERTPDLKPEPVAAAQAKIDSWLANALAKVGKEFEGNLRLAAAAGSRNSNVSEVARFLLHRPDRSFEYLDIWGPPEHQEVWYARMRADPSVKALVETFIRELMPQARDHFGSRFSSEAERLAPGLTSAFLAAAAKAVYFGVTSSSDVIAESALRDLAGFEAIVDAAVEVLTPNDAARQDAVETRLAITNEEYSEDYAEHIADNDDGYTAGEFLGAYVDRVRATVGWRQLAEHRHRDHLLFYWFRALAKDDAFDSDELAGAFAIGLDSRNEDNLWHALAKAWDPAFEAALVRRVMEGHPKREVRIAALTCLVQQGVMQIAAISLRLTEHARYGRLVELALELAELRHYWLRTDDAPKEQAVAGVATQLPRLVREVSEAAFALATNAVPTLSDDTRELLLRIYDPSEEVRVFRLSLDRHVPMFVPEDVHSLLKSTDEVANAEEAMEAAIRHRMAAEIEAGLSHRFAAVVVQALKAVTASLLPPLPERILLLARAKGSPVRRALVELLDAKPHHDHLAALLLLAKDEWSRRASYGEDENYPVARAAVAALGKLGAISHDAGEELYRIAINTRDADVQYKIFALLARMAETRSQLKLFELAVNPGRQRVRRAAAHALMAAYQQIEPEILTRITPQLLATRIESVASRLLLLLSFRGELNEVLKSAEVLATDEKRRVLLLLAIWVVRERDLSVAERIASMLPTNHAGVSWAITGAKEEIGDTALDDLGDPLSVKQVISFMQRNPKKR